ncbi:MAG TPA: right-handed parallel beta-helix repeat-containing protein, partial [Caldilineaceae bacterium]|nr:right-handed parallel beta-helix repeat-containing protein [Caldilineaceae bacterium]
LLLPSDITVCGEGYGSILKLRDGTLDALFTNQDWTAGNDHITLRDLRLEGNQSNNVQGESKYFPRSSADQDKSHGINFHYVQDSLLENLTVADFYYDGIYLGTSVPDRYSDGEEDRSSGSNRNTVRQNRIIGNGRNGISITRGTDNTIVNNLLQDNNRGVLGAAPERSWAGAITIEPNGDWYDVSRNIVQSNQLLNNHYNGVQLLKNWTSTGILLSANVIAGTTRHGIAAGLISGLIIQGNHVSTSGAAGLDFVGNGSTGILVNGANGARVVVIANMAVGNGLTDPYGAGIVWVDAQAVTLVGNISLDNGSGPRAQILAAGADPIYAANRVGPLGVPAANRVVRDTDFFAQLWRMYGSDTEIALENQRTGKTYTVPIEQIS